MRADPLYRPITAAEFVEIDFGTDRKFELVDGVIQMMTGGSIKHAWASGNIYHFLRGKLIGSGCMPFNSDLGVRINETNVRYPDVSVFCAKPLDRAEPGTQALDNPVAIFEVLSQSTSRTDQGRKLDEYRQLSSVDTIVFVDPDNELTRIVQRIGPSSWRDDMFAQPHDVPLPALGVTIPHGEIYLYE